MAVLIARHGLMGNTKKNFAAATTAGHATTTAMVAIYYGKIATLMTSRGRTAHESIFNLKDDRYRCPSSQAGLLALHHLDPRDGMGHLRVYGTVGVPHASQRRGITRNEKETHPHPARPQPHPRQIFIWSTRVRMEYRFGTPGLT